MAYRFTDELGTFELENADMNSYLYFPLCNEAGIMSCITPTLGGDIKLDQNRFIMQPVSVEDLHNNKSTRNFWLRFDDGGIRSAAGVSVWQRAERTQTGKYPVLRAGLLWHEITNEIRYKDACIKSVITNFVPSDETTAEIMHISLENTGKTTAKFDPIAVIPMYGRSAVNIRDHRHVTALLHRISTEKYGVRIKPTLSFDERGHIKNETEYFTLGCSGCGEAPRAFYPTVADVTGEGGDFEFPMELMSTKRKNDPSGRGSDNKTDGFNAGAALEGVEAVGGLRFAHVNLQPGEKAEYILFIGAKNPGDSSNDADSIIERFGDENKYKRALEDNKTFWLRKAQAGLPVGKSSVTEEDTDLNDYLLWVGAEPVLRRIFGCSFLPYHDYGKGGRGWRDLWQDCLALMLGDPSSVRDLLINNFAGVRADGTNATIIGSKPGEFIADRNGIARVWMDHGVWPWITVQLYMELSGDTEFLKTGQRYFKDMLCCRARDTDTEKDERAAVEDSVIGDNTADTCGCKEKAGNSISRDRNNILLDATGREYLGSILEHILLMHITAACDVGEHGHMLLRGADWNDALDMAPEKGESVAFTMAYAGNLKEIAGFLRGKPEKYDILKEIKTMIDELADVSSEQGASNAIYQKKRGILDKYCNLVRHTVTGEKVGVTAEELSEKLELIAASIMEHVRKTEYMAEGRLGWYNGYYDNEGLPVESLKDKRLMLTSAVFAIMSGTADDDQVKAIMRTADEYLCREEIGGYRLNTRFENEEAYAHKLGRMFGFAYGSKENGAVFCHMAVMYAYALLKRGFENEARKVVKMLINQSMRFDSSRIYPGIPEYFNIHGRGMYPYLTGAASWMLLFFNKL